MSKITPFQEHVNHWKNCKDCQLCETRKKVVLYGGSIPCDILLVGEAPGVSENRIGTPFVGPAGHLLDDMVRDSVDITGICHCGASCFCTAPDRQWHCQNGHTEAKLHRAIKFGKTNLIGCIPYDENLDKVSDPPVFALDACQMRLDEIVEMAKPTGIVAVGRIPYKRLKDKYGVPMVEVTHPAAILRASYAQKGFAIQRMVARLSNFYTELQYNA